MILTTLLISLFPQPARAARVACTGKLAVHRQMLKASYDFPAVERRLEVTEGSLEHRPGERNRDRIRRQVITLVDTATGAEIWSLGEFPDDKVTAAVVDPRDPNAVILAKRVDRLLPVEAAEPGFKPHKAYPSLVFKTTHEIVRVGGVRDGRLKWRELLDVDEPVLSLRDEGGEVRATTPAREIAVER